MSKYSDQFKLTAVQAYLEGPCGFRTIARQFAVDVSLLRRWVSIYQQHGCIKPRTQGQHYSPEFKRSVLEYMCKHRLSLRQTATHFGLGQSSQVGNWARQHYSSGITPNTRKRKVVAMPKKPYPLKPVSDDDSQKTREQLLAELEYLRMENACLKKLEELKEQNRRRPGKKP